MKKKMKKKLYNSFSRQVISKIEAGGVGVIPTDTLYGLVGSALNKKAVEKIYRLKNRNPKKPLIILISSLSDLKLFGINLSPVSKKLIAKFWPGKISIIFKCLSSKFHYLHRGTETLAFRLPRPKKLRTFLKKTGPLVAPSANLEGHPPAQTAKQAQKYFGDKVDFYIDAGRLTSQPSKLISIVNGKIKYLRK